MGKHISRPNFTTHWRQQRVMVCYYIALLTSPVHFLEHFRRFSFHNCKHNYRRRYILLQVSITGLDGIWNRVHIAESGRTFSPRGHYNLPFGTREAQFTIHNNLHTTTSNVEGCHTFTHQLQTVPKAYLHVEIRKSLTQTITRVILTSEDNGTPNSEGKSFQREE